MQTSWPGAPGPAPAHPSYQSSSQHHSQTHLLCSIPIRLIFHCATTLQGHPHPVLSPTPINSSCPSRQGSSSTFHSLPHSYPLQAYQPPINYLKIQPSVLHWCCTSAITQDLHTEHHSLLPESVGRKERGLRGWENWLRLREAAWGNQAQCLRTISK